MTAAALASAAVTVPSATLFVDLEAAFRKDPALRAVVVADGDGSPALMTRTRLEQVGSGPLGYGRALHHRRPVGELADHDVLVLEPDASLDAAAEAMLARPLARRWDEALLRAEGGWSLVSASEVMASLAEHHARRAATDLLTGLPNRAALEQHLRQRLQRGEPTAVAYLDLDGFKAVNDGLGHAEGDRVLQAFASVLRERLPAAVELARIAGDEFALVCADETHAGVAAAVAIRVARGTTVRGARRFRVSASAGVAPAVAGDTPERLLARADTAMYRAKQRRGVVVRHDANVDREHTEFDRLGALQSAVAEGELRLHYQPVVELPSGRRCGVEALLRWTRPDGTVMSPADFVPLAERTGLIVPITRLVLETACLQARLWVDAWGDEAPVMSVNLSPVSLATAAVVTDVRRALEVNDLPPELLRLEVTETAAVADLGVTAQVLDGLRELGCTVALDDFGTGHSSLHVLRRLPVDVVKVDRSFLADVGRDPTGTAFVGHLVDLAHTLGLQVTAEGVEELAQAEALSRLGCDSAQGWLYGRPVPPEQLPRPGRGLTLPLPLQVAG